MSDLQLPNISLAFADLAISAGRDFGVPASKRVRRLMPDVKYSLRGYRPLSALGFHGHASMNSQMPDDAWSEVEDQMNRLHVRYIVESFHTCIGWVDASGNWHILPYRYSLTTTEHQGIMCAAIGVAWRMIDTTRVIMSDDVKIGRPGF